LHTPLLHTPLLLTPLPLTLPLRPLLPPVIRRTLGLPLIFPPCPLLPLPLPPSFPSSLPLQEARPLATPLTNLSPLWSTPCPPLPKRRQSPPAFSPRLEVSAWLPTTRLSRITTRRARTRLRSFIYLYQLTINESNL
ncbi:hypothetical protein PFISCL1PPCAC_27144, partial [Pristionchus fissidentatus]